MFNPLALIPGKALGYIKIGLIVAACVAPLLTYGCGRMKGRELAENAYAAQALEDFEAISKLRDDLKDAQSKANEAAVEKKAAVAAASKDLKDDVNESVQANPTDGSVCRAPTYEHDRMRAYADEANRPR